MKRLSHILILTAFFAITVGDVGFFVLYQGLKSNQVSSTILGTEDSTEEQENHGEKDAEFKIFQDTNQLALHFTIKELIYHSFFLDIHYSVGQATKNSPPPEAYGVNF